jgi:glycine cleavage system aminomethyltransferase T
MRLQVIPANPYEMGLGGLIDLAGGHDFVGRAALAALAATPPARQRCGFWVEGNPASPGHQVAVTQGDTVVGYLSELVYSPRLQRSIGIGLIRADLVQATDLTATLPGGPVGVIPTDLPFKIPS